MKGMDWTAGKKLLERIFSPALNIVTVVGIFYTNE
jgi:hypothetical protein